MNTDTSQLLNVRDLRVSFRQDGKVTEAVRGVSFSVGRGETVALVGESGSGKSVTALSTVSLLGDSASVSGSVTYDGQEMVGASERHLRQVRGNDISFIFQEPMTSLNPLHTIEKQLAESLALHQGLDGKAARARIVDLLNRVGIRDAENRLGAYPHQLSGGQRQRVMIAMALANKPDILIADEPTTALDVTIQQQIAHRADAYRREAGHKGKADNIQLRPARDQRAGGGKDQNGCVIQKGEDRHAFALPCLNGAMPARASSSARSFSG